MSENLHEKAEIIKSLVNIPSFERGSQVLSIQEFFRTSLHFLKIFFIINPLEAACNFSYDEMLMP